MKKLTVIVLAYFLFLTRIGNAYALPSKPSLPGGPGGPGLVQPSVPPIVVPPTPKLPPCVECDEFLGTPKPTKSPSPKPTVAPTNPPSNPGSPTDNRGGDGGSSGGGGGNGGVGGGGQVLSLADTSSDGSAVTLATVFGIICLSLGVYLRKNAVTRN